MYYVATSSILRVGSLVISLGLPAPPKQLHLPQSQFPCRQQKPSIAMITIEQPTAIASLTHSPRPYKPSNPSFRNSSLSTWYFPLFKNTPID